MNTKEKSLDLNLNHLQICLMQSCGLTVDIHDMFKNFRNKQIRSIYNKWYKRFLKVHKENESFAEVLAKDSAMYCVGLKDKAFNCFVSGDDSSWKKLYGQIYVLRLMKRDNDNMTQEKIAINTIFENSIDSLYSLFKDDIDYESSVNSGFPKLLYNNIYVGDYIVDCGFLSQGIKYYSSFIAPLYTLMEMTKFPDMINYFVLDDIKSDELKYYIPYSMRVSRENDAWEEEWIKDMKDIEFPLCLNAYFCESGPVSHLLKNKDNIEVIGNIYLERLRETYEVLCKKGR